MTASRNEVHCSSKVCVFVCVYVALERIVSQHLLIVLKEVGLVEPTPYGLLFNAINHLFRHVVVTNLQLLATGCTCFEQPTPEVYTAHTSDVYCMYGATPCHIMTYTIPSTITCTYPFALRTHIRYPSSLSTHISYSDTWLHEHMSAQHITYLLNTVRISTSSNQCSYNINMSIAGCIV